MVNQTTRFFALSALAVLLAGPAIAQQVKDAGIPGFYNPKTHTFQAKVTPSATPEASTAVYTGTLEFEITVKLATPVASGQEVVCSGSSTVVDLSGTSYDEESASGVAKVSGSSATCTVKIPYAWSLSDGSSDTVSLTYELEIVPTSVTNPYLYTSRIHSSELAPIKVPTNGATTPIVISATI